MKADNVAAQMENSGLSAAGAGAALEPEPVQRRFIGSMPALVLDFDSLGIETTKARLKASSAPCMFVVWYPGQYKPSEIDRFHNELVQSGAILIEKESKEQAFLTCWAAWQAELEERMKRQPKRTGRFVAQGSDAPRPHC